MVPGPTAHAEGPGTVSDTVFVGLVRSSVSGGVLPMRVQAVTPDGTVCGSTRVLPTDTAGVGVYVMTVFGAETKSGCPVFGSPIGFRLLADRMDEGRLALGYRYPAATPQPFAAYRTGEVTMLHLLSSR